MPLTMPALKTYQTGCRLCAVLSSETTRKPFWTLVNGSISIIDSRRLPDTDNDSTSLWGGLCLNIYCTNVFANESKRKHWYLRENRTQPIPKPNDDQT
mmetsp:Transcript_3141/g.7026  ORF Transcript_3141/g.7026 Transcript_3141/m.7026 type:complete len:98 (+) Transcript_3141:645-938(+)